MQRCAFILTSDSWLLTPLFSLVTRHLPLVTVLLAPLESYLLGSIPFGYLLYKFREGGDVRSIGSGNIGATNVLRGAGIGAAAATLLLDGAKGFMAVTLARLLTGNSPEWISLAAVLAIAGHVFPVFLKFRGGKGVATGFGVFLALSPLPVLSVAGIFLIVAGVSRYISLASISAVAAFPFVLLAWGGASVYSLGAAVIGAVLIVSRHSSNIHRLLSGQEPQLGRAR